MIVSHEWLKQFVPHDLDATAVGDALSRHCVTLDGIEKLGAKLAPFIVAQVVEAGRHPNSDHLWVTKVDDGSGTLLDVVCGAPNVVAGTKYPFARTGTVMPSGLKIEKRKIRGETSNGMLCSARELELGEEHDGILALDTAAAPGTPLLDVLAVGDARLDLDVLPNRPDLLSHRGVAREVAAITGVAMRAIPTDITAAASAIGAVTGATTAQGTHASVTIEDSTHCPRYVAVVIRGVSVGASPSWLSARLDAIGARSISNVVDATNYVLHGFGQPVHAFDLGKLSGARIVVRPTRAGESLTTLDGSQRKLDAGTTVICDGAAPVALAGVMGGLDSEVTTATTDILLEVAQFDAKFVRRVRKSVGLVTDASYRYERGVDAGDTLAVARLAAALITQVAGGDVIEVLDVGAAPAPRASVTLRPHRVARLLGVSVDDATLVRLLEALGCTVQRAGVDFAVQPPSWRYDLGMEVDLIEEIARLVGFDALPDELRPFRPGNAPDHPLHLATQRVRGVLVTAGLLEAKPMPFTAVGDERTPRVRNPLADDEPYLRASILDTLARRAEYNLSRMEGDLRLFEVGNVFLPSTGRLPREEVRVGALLMGARRPAHFTESQPPAFDAWDARDLAERVMQAAFPSAQVVCVPRDDAPSWMLDVDGVTVGHVGPVTLDRPAWAKDTWGLEFTLGVLSSDDIAPAHEHAHGADAAGQAPTRAAIRFVPLPTTPAAVFDVALIVPDGTSAAAVEASMRATAGELLESCQLFDEYRGDGVAAGSRSLAWRLTFRHPERTLKDREIEGRRAKLLEALARDLGVTPRSA